MGSIEFPADRNAKLEALRGEIDALRRQLAESEATLDAIRSGDVDALVVAGRLYLLEGLENESSRLRGEMIAQVDDAIIAVDGESRVIFFNAAAERQYGVALSDVLGRSLDELYEARWIDSADEQQAAESLRTCGSWFGPNVHIRRDGSAIHVESTISVTRGRDGEPTGRIAVIRDVSERVARELQAEQERLESEQALRDADRRKDEFLATLAHELRNPLAPILHALQIVQLSQDEDVRENALRIIERQHRQIVHLVDDLLDISRISQGKVELRRQRVDIVTAIHAAVETSRPMVDASHHQLTVRLPASNSVVVDGDETRLCQIVANLLNNAAKYTPHGGHIEVEVRAEGATALINVRDSGVGIAPEMLPLVFDMYTQVDRSRAHAQGGLGIGLALVKRLVELHGGRVCARSDGPGRGSEFTLELPRVVAASGQKSDDDKAP